MSAGQEHSPGRLLLVLDARDSACVGLYPSGSNWNVPAQSHAACCTSSRQPSPVGPGDKLTPSSYAPWASVGIVPGDWGLKVMSVGLNLIYTTASESRIWPMICISIAIPFPRPTQPLVSVAWPPLGLTAPASAKTRADHKSNVTPALLAPGAGQKGLCAGSQPISLCLSFLASGT